MGPGGGGGGAVNRVVHEASSMHLLPVAAKQHRRALWGLFFA